MVKFVYLGISSVLHEQKNRTLDKLKATAPFMRLESFVHLLVFVLATLNAHEDSKVSNK